MSGTKKIKESIKYEEMLVTVENTIKTLNQGEIPLDELLAKVKDSYELIDVMKKRLSETKIAIEKLSDEYNESKTP
ncbi:MAG: exodeoxyribonuclease VII small subunit [Oligoflexales bacterium]|nr:exodeoxyribonuclease VII small subunit [Oligoflexales bacterium]